MRTLAKTSATSASEGFAALVHGPVVLIAGKLGAEGGCASGHDARVRAHLEMHVLDVLHEVALEYKARSAAIARERALFGRGAPPALARRRRGSGRSGGRGVGVHHHAPERAVGRGLRGRGGKRWERRVVRCRGCRIVGAYKRVLG